MPMSLIRVRALLLQHETISAHKRVVSVHSLVPFPVPSASCLLTPPNSSVGSGLKRLEYRTEEWDVDFTNYLAGLRKDRRVILTGDLNCAREPIDIHNAKGNLKSAGFTPEERESFQKVQT